LEHGLLSRGVKWKSVFQVFPFSVVFDDQLTIVYVGRTLQKLFSAEPPSVRQQSRRVKPSQAEIRRDTPT